MSSRGLQPFTPGFSCKPAWAGYICWMNVAHRGHDARQADGDLWE